MEIQTLIDTGSHINVINKDTFDRLKATDEKIELQQQKIVARSVSGEILTCYGVTTVPVSAGGIDVMTKCWVMEVPRRALLGREYLKDSQACINFKDMTMKLQGVTVEMITVRKEKQEKSTTNCAVAKRNENAHQENGTAILRYDQESIGSVEEADFQQGR
jgi:hypothetical protein